MMVGVFLLPFSFLRCLRTGCVLPWLALGTGGHQCQCGAGWAQAARGAGAWVTPAGLEGGRQHPAAELLGDFGCHIADCHITTAALGSGWVSQSCRAGHPKVFGSAVGPIGWHKLSSGLVAHDQVWTRLAGR